MIFRYILPVLGLSAVLSGSCMAATGDSSNPNASVCNAALGVSCGLVIGPNFNLGSSKIASASVINGIVRVSSDQDITVTGMGEIHHYIYIGNKVALGLFAGVGASGTADPSPSFAVGGIMGFPGATNNSPLDLLLGVSFIPAQQVLGDGVLANQPLPAGVSSVYYKTTTTIGIFLGVGAHF